MTAAASTDSTPRPKPRPVPPTLGSAAGFLALCLVCFGVVGALWGVLRPTYEAVVTEDGGMMIAPAHNVEFESFISFVVATGLLGALLAVVMFLLSTTTRGVLMLLWVTVCAVFGAVVFLFAGDLVVSVVNPVPEVETVDAGESFSLVPGINPGIGLAAAPFMAALAYWCSALVSPED